MSSPQGFVIRAEGLCGFQIRSYITRGLTNCLPPSRLGITQTSLVLLSLLRRLQIPVNPGYTMPSRDGGRQQSNPQLYYTGITNPREPKLLSYD